MLISLLIVVQILSKMTEVMGPILPHLAEEIRHHREGANADQSLSVFTRRWEDLVRRTLYIDVL
jgi:isoleucyl-tRNA synthetase